MEGARGNGDFQDMHGPEGMALTLPENESDESRNNKRLLSPPPLQNAEIHAPVGEGVDQRLMGVSNNVLPNTVDDNEARLPSKTINSFQPEDNSLEGIVPSVHVGSSAKPVSTLPEFVEHDTNTVTEDTLEPASDTPVQVLVRVAEKIFPHFSLADLLFFKATNYSQYNYENGFDLVLQEIEGLLEATNQLIRDLLDPIESQATASPSDLILSPKMEHVLGMSRHWCRRTDLHPSVASDLNTLLPQKLGDVEVKKEYNVSTFLNYHKQNLKEMCGLHSLHPTTLSKMASSDLEANIKQEQQQQQNKDKTYPKVPLALCQKCGKEIQEQGDVFDQDLVITPDIYADDFLFPSELGSRKRGRKKTTKVTRKRKQVKYEMDDDFIAPDDDEGEEEETRGFHNNSNGTDPNVKADPDESNIFDEKPINSQSKVEGAIDGPTESRDKMKRTKLKRRPKLEMNEDGEYCCKRCKEAFKDELSFARHETICNPQNVPIPKYDKLGENQFRCKFRLCNSNQVFPSLFSLRKHFFSTHVSEEDLKFPCEYCGQRFARGGALNDHITSKHKKNHTCEECGKAFNAPNRLREHMLTHTGAKPFACDLCDHKCARSNALKRHKELVHKKFEIGNYFCDICGRSFNQERILRRHINQTHENPKEEVVHQCQRCDYIADNKSHLTQHMTIHHSDTADDQYPCDQCNKAFRIEKYLKYHKKYVHSGKTRNKRSGGMGGEGGEEGGNSRPENDPESGDGSIDLMGANGPQEPGPLVHQSLTPVQLLIPNPPDHHSTASNSTNASPGPTPNPLQQQRFMSHLPYPPYSFNLN